MPRTFASSRVRRAAGVAAAGALAATALVGSAGPASADTVLKVTYPVTDASSTYIASTDSSMKLGPGTLKSELVLETGDLTANLSLPPAQGEFKEFGVIPVSVTTTLIPDGPATGRSDPNTGAVTSTAKVWLKLSNLKVAGIPTPVGDNCKTKTPATIQLTSADDWSVLNGGTLNGTYTIPQFEHCLLATPLINLTVPGAGNTVTLKLGPAEFES